MPEEFHTKQYLELGCEGDYCIYSDYEPNKRREDNSFCCVGGHIHIGLKKLDWDIVENLVRLLDYYLTIPNLSKEKGERRRLYGQAGTFRYSTGKAYFEYRTPSNWWIFTEEDRALVYDTVEWVINNMDNLQVPLTDEEIKKSINENIHEVSLPQ